MITIATAHGRMTCTRAAMCSIIARVCFVSGGCATIPGAYPGKAELVAFDQIIPNTTVSFRMVPVSAGTIDIPDASDPANHRRVNIKPFWIATTEVTWDQYDLFVYTAQEQQPGAGATDAVTHPSKPYLPPDRGFGHAGYPAMSMSFRGADEFCKWLSAKTGKSYRLPTVAEWEWACRAGAGSTEQPATRPSIDDQAWHAGNAGETTHSVGKKQSNSLGVFDMLGNVAEWCLGIDGKPITCGGSYRDAGVKLSCGLRMAPSPKWNASDPQLPKSQWWLADCSFVGFRAVCVPADESQNGGK